MDAQAHRTTFLYDAANQEIATVNPLQQRTTQGYDKAGQPTLRIDARGFRTTYAYDPVGQRTQRRYPDGTRTTWIYDPVGNPLAIAAPAGTFTRTYDPLDQVRQLQWPTGEILTWTYDAAGNRRSRETSIGTTTYLFDANAQLTKLVNEHEEVTSFSYDPVGREILKELDNGTRASIVYDAAGQTLSVSNLEEAGDVISRFTYLYDPAGNRLQERREDGSQKHWSYDPTNQLTYEEIADGVGTSRTTYVYDPVGNRLVLNVDGELTTSTYDAANRLINALDLSGATTYTFDANGNQRSVETPTGEITTYSWSYENQLIQTEEPDDVVTTQVYAPVTRNSDELRFSRETDAGTVNFLWDNQNIIREVDDTNSVEAEYTLNPQPYGNLVSQHRENESTFYNYDALGSTQSLTDETGTVSNEYTYSAFGKILNQTGSTENPFGWVGELGYYQNPDGSYTLRRRDYTAEENRFCSEDPIQADEENLYRYVRNNPVNLVDPSGLAPEGATCSTCSTSGPTVDADIYEEASLEEILSKILGPVYGPKFLETQGVAAGSKVVDLYIGGWRFKIGGRGKYSLYMIDPPSARIQVYDSLVGNEGISDCPFESDVRLSELEICKNLATAINDPEALPHYRGESQESWVLAGTAAFCSHPNIRIATGTAEIIGSVLVIAGSGGTASPIILLAAGYGAVRGADSLAGGAVEIVTGRQIRDLSSQALDLLTGNQDVTNVIIFTLDIGVIAVEFGGAGRQFYKKAGKKKVTAAPVGLADDLLSSANYVIPKPGFTDVFIHAEPNSFAIFRNGEWIHLSHRDISNYLKSKGVSGNIRLLSCEAGQARLAQDLANKLGVTVEAATTNVYLPVGWKSQPMLAPGGKWIDFFPGAVP